MENLNDVEFGSDKSTEEAPILVAQRYLNIFRQIHIFNKEKRNQFDDELLALPQNILDFFKRMPGGRLLVEHIEDVKTERGISFVKSNRADFTDGDTSTPSANASNGGMAMDTSFAQTLAASMASVIKQAPAQAATGGADAEVLATLNKTFQLIAEEVKLSRDSMFQVLQETRQITNAVISSQIALSNLLEKLCNGTARIADMPTKDIAAEEKAPLHSANTSNENTNLESQNIPAQQAISSAAGETESTFGENVKKKKKKKKHNAQQENGGQNAMPASNVAQPNVSQTDLALKSEKIAPAFSGIIRNVASKHNDDFTNVQLDELSPEDNFGDIHTQDAQPDFNDSDTSFSSQTDFEPSQDETFAEEPAPETDIVAGLDSFMEDPLDFSQSEQTAVSPDLSSEYLSEPFVANESNNLPESDGLDFTLPSQLSSQIEQTMPQEKIEQLDGFPNADGLDYSLPEQNTSVPEPADNFLDGLDTFINTDGLDFTLPQQNSAGEDEPETVSAFSTSQDNLSSDDGLDFALPEQGSTDTETTDLSELDSLISDTDDEFTIPLQDTASELPVETSDAFSGLDDLVDNSLDTAFPAEDETPHEDEDTVSGALDDFIQQTPNDVHEEPSEEPLQDVHPQEAHSRYSEELDKIRAALTSDNIDVSSINQPIALDDYSDDENVSDDSETDLGSLLDSTPTPQPTTEEAPSDNEDWEWEYVDENGNPIENADGEGEDWEWEYVEDDGTENEPDNNNK